METKNPTLWVKIQQGYVENPNACANCSRCRANWCLLGGFYTPDHAVCELHDREEEM